MWPVKAQSSLISALSLVLIASLETSRGKPMTLKQHELQDNQTHDECLLTLKGLADVYLQSHCCHITQIPMHHWTQSGDKHGRPLADNVKSGPLLKILIEELSWMIHNCLQSRFTMAAFLVQHLAAWDVACQVRLPSPLYGLSKTLHKNLICSVRKIKNKNCCIKHPIGLNSTSFEDDMKRIYGASQTQLERNVRGERTWR